MKKIVGIVAAASLVAGLAFADGPTANLAVTDFTGNASVQWGVDLDSGTTGFKNAEYMKFVINLFDAGGKSTSGDDVWAELVMKAGNTKSWTHRLYQYDKETAFTADGNASGIEGSELSFDIDTAKIHFGDFFVGIQNGDTVTGEYKVDSAVRGYDHWKGQGKWLENVGPDKYTQGIVAGFANDNLGVDIDFRSAPDGTNQYTSNYAVAAELKLKDSNEWVEGLFVDLGGSVNLTESKFSAGAAKAATAAKEELKWGKLPKENAVAVTGITGFTAATETTEGWYVETTPAAAASGIDGEAVETVFNTRTMGYSGSLGYKLKLDDKYWLKPTVAFAGTYETEHNKDNTVKKTSNDGFLVAGAMLGWGDPCDGGGLYYFDNGNDNYKKCASGASVVVGIPFASKTTTTTNAGTTSTTTNGAVQALVMPAFYTNGDLVEGLKAAVYSEIALLRGLDAADQIKGAGTNDVTYFGSAKDKDDTFALALAAAVAYDIKADEITVTPQAGFRFANTAYADNGISDLFKHGDNDPAFFTDLGDQKPVADAASKRIGLYENGFFNLKAGINVNGLINNTDIFAVYQSANLLNGKSYDVKASNDPEKTAKFYNVKLGTFNVGCKISL